MLTTQESGLPLGWDEWKGEGRGPPTTCPLRQGRVSNPSSKSPFRSKGKRLRGDMGSERHRTTTECKGTALWRTVVKGLYKVY